MFNKSLTRNQRSEGVKIKHGLQILFLVGICFWLIYQVKYSHDEKRKLNEKEAKTSAKDESGGAVKLGRKDLHPRRDETATTTNRAQDEEESREENDESRHDKEHGEETSEHEVDHGEEL